MGINEFTDMTQEEFAQTYLTLRVPEDEEIVEVSDEVSIPTATVDWSSKVVVKNQGSCGSCWAFSATGAVEALYAIKKGSSVNLAEQQLVDCSTANYGCNGGWPNKAMSWIASNGIVSQSSYPYTAKTGTCKQSTGTYKVSGSNKVTASQSGLQAAITNYPVSVCVDATNWSKYSSGVFSNCGTSTNHAVLAVGFDGSGNWKIRNSWGTSWG